MVIQVSDRELVSVVSFLFEATGEEAMEAGLRLYEAFDLGTEKLSVPQPGSKIDLSTFQGETRDYDVQPADVKALRAVLARPGQSPAMWLNSARALRRIRESMQPKAAPDAP